MAVSGGEDSPSFPWKDKGQGTGHPAVPSVTHEWQVRARSGVEILAWPCLSWLSVSAHPHACPVNLSTAVHVCLSTLMSTPYLSTHL